MPIPTPIPTFTRSKGEEKTVSEAADTGQRIFFRESSSQLLGLTLAHPCNDTKVQKPADYSLTEHRQQAGGKLKVCQFPSRVPLATP